jgi:hypothetical protein
MRGAVSPLPSTPSWRGAQFKKKKRKDNFTVVSCFFAVLICNVTALQIGRFLLPF